MPTVFSKCILATALASVSIMMTASAARCATDSLVEGTVVEISSSGGGMEGGLLDDHDWFGRSVTAVGDVDENGAVDMVVGASLDDDDGTATTVDNVGAVYLLLMEADGSRVKSSIKLSSYTTGKFNSNPNDQFGRSVAGGVDAKGGRFDVDNDGMWDLVVGARRGDGDGVNDDCGSVYVLFMKDDGNDNYSVREVKEISHGEGGLGYSLSTGDFFGTSVAVVGDDLENPMVAVGAPSSDGGQGAVYVLALNANGTVKTEKKIGLGEGGLQAVLGAQDRFGDSLTAMDLTGDGVNELVVSALYDDDGYVDAGAVYVLSLDSQGGVISEQKISATTQGGLLQASLEAGDLFGSAVTELGDLDGDGVVDLAVGAHADDDGGNNNRGAVYVLLLNSDGSVKAHGKVSATAGGFDGAPLGAGENFGSGLAKLGEKSASGVLQLAVGARNDRGSGSQRGAVYVLKVPSLFVNPCESDEQCLTDEECLTSGEAASYTCVPALDICASGALESERKIASGESGFVGSLSAWDGFGRAVVSVGDVDKDGVVDLAVGAPFDDDGGLDRGAVYILFMNSDGSVKGEYKISSLPGVGYADRFGVSVEAMGDMDGDGVVDLAVGAQMDDDGGPNRGAVYILFLSETGSVKSQTKISGTQVGVNSNNVYFGSSLAAMDVDNDGLMDLAVGAISVAPGGAVYILFLDANGAVSGQQKISSTEGGLTGVVSYFGSSVASVGDLDQDGVVDLAVGVPFDNDSGIGGYGAVYILFLKTDGTVRAQQKISGAEGGLQSLGMSPNFGSAVARIGDLDGDGVADLAVGARRYNDYEGAVVILLLKPNGTVKAQQLISSSQGGLVDSLYKAELGDGLSVWGDCVLNAEGMMRLAVGAPHRASGSNGAGVVYVLGVSPGFAPVCAAAETCVDTGYGTYECN